MMLKPRRTLPAFKKEKVGQGQRRGREGPLSDTLSDDAR